MGLAGPHGDDAIGDDLPELFAYPAAIAYAQAVLEGDGFPWELLSNLFDGHNRLNVGFAHGPKLQFGGLD